MSYCAQADLITRYGEEELIQLTDRTGSGVIDGDVVARAIADSDGEIDGYVSAAGYALPLSPIPSILTAYGCDIARYRLMADQATEQVRKRYEDAVKFLRALAAGLVRLDAREPDPVLGEAEFSAGRKVFAGGGY